MSCVPESCEYVINIQKDFDKIEKDNDWIRHENKILAEQKQELLDKITKLVEEKHNLQKTLTATLSIQEEYVDVIEELQNEIEHLVCSNCPYYYDCWHDDDEHNDCFHWELLNKEIVNGIEEI